MLKRKRTAPRPKADVNVTPFIDILLVLLVIFMTITPMTPVGFRTQIPQEPPPVSNPQPDDRTVVISMDTGGTIRINQQIVERAELTSALRNIYKTRNDKTAFVNADRGLLFSEVAQLIDAARIGGVEHVGLMTAAITP